MKGYELASETMSPVDLSRILRAYECEWVAFDKKTHSVIAHGESLRTVKESAARKGAKSPTFTFVPAFDSYFAS